MRLDVQASVSLAVLYLLNVCQCLQDLAENTLDTIGSSEFMQSPSSLFANEQVTDKSDAITAEVPNKVPNFLLIDRLADGEMERRIQFDGLTAKETSIGNQT